MPSITPHRSRFRAAARSTVLTFALFGLASATVLLFLPEKLPDITKSLYAFGNKDYRLPEAGGSTVQTDGDARALKAFAKVFVNIGKQTRPALVYIESKRVVKGDARRHPLEDFFFGFPFGLPNGRDRGGVQQGAGSGFIVDLKNGYVMTNNHVIDGMTELKVQTFDNRTFNAKVIGAHKDTDVAIIQLEKFAAQNLKQVALGNSDAVEVGDWVVALGAPFQLPQTLTVGVVSATGRENVMGERSSIQDFIQTDAAINPGNSGGPLVNLDGQVIGINTAIYSRTGSYSGIGFAVPSKLARVVAESLINNGKVSRGYLGVAMGEDPTSAGLPEGTGGVVVTKVYPNTAAEKAGLKLYDVIQSVNSQPINSAGELRLKIAFSKPGDTVTLGILRDGKKVSAAVKLGEYTDEEQKVAVAGNQPGKFPAAEGFGILLQELTPELRKSLNIRTREGVLIGDVDGDSEAAVQLQQGDVILEINRARVKSPRDAEKILAGSTSSGKNLVFLIERDGTTQLVVFRGQFRSR
jgi:serine protease Do